MDQERPSAPSDDHDLVELSDRFPTWYVWRGRGRDGQVAGWYATARTGSRRGYPMPLHADGPRELERQLEQDEASCLVARAS